MDLSNLQQTWKRLEDKLEKSNRLNLELLRKVNLDRAQNKLKNLVWQQAITIAFYLLAGSYFIHFSATHLENWHYVIAGGILAAWSFIASASAIHQLQLILTIDYSMPVLQLQKRLISIKTTIIKNLRIAVWVLPFYMAFVVWISELFFGIDFIAITDTSALSWNFILSGLLIPVVWWMHRKLNPKNADKKWLNWLLQGSGSQVNEALEFLKEIDEFVEEEF
jgi:hypothetical protein